MGPQIFLVVVLAATIGCRQQPSTILKDSPEQVLARLNNVGHAVDASLGGGKVRYLGFEVMPEGALPGDQVTVLHYWYANGPLEAPYRVFVHGLVQGAMGWVDHGDHMPVPSPDQWPVNLVVRDEHVLRLPERLPADAVELRVGLYLGNDRLPVDDARKHDGTNRIRAGKFSVSGEPLPLPSYYAPRLSVAPKLDGKIEDAEWGGAPWIEEFKKSRGDGSSSLKTRARLAWDPDHLYLAFEAEDPDIQAPQKKRDDPVYQHEALEIFVDPKGTGDYVELQASPRAVLFDAAFTGGPRRNMQVEFDARYEVGVATNGTIDDPQDRDVGWSTEWAIDVASLPGGEKLGTDSLRRINLFRIAKDRIGGRQVVDESAWSPPLMGDFHNLERFGLLRFTEHVGDATR